MLKQIALAAIAATVGPVAIIVLMGPRLAAQVTPPTADTPPFEAASVRPAADTGRRGGRGTPGRFNGFNLPARQLIRQAYDIHDAQIVGGPDWVASDGFDITATTGDKPPDQMRFMMQTLLRDRFKLTFHTETRPEARPATGHCGCPGDRLGGKTHGKLAGFRWGTTCKIRCRTQKSSAPLRTNHGGWTS